MNFDIVHPVDFQDDILTLDKTVEHSKEFKIIVPNRGTYIVFPRDDFKLQIVRKIQVPVLTEVSVAFGICRPQIAKKIFFSAGAYGVNSITVFESSLIEGDYKTSKVYKSPETILLDGMRQSGSWVQPKVVLMKFQEFVANIKTKPTVVFDRVTGEPCSIDKILSATSFVLGPEKGLTKEEIEILTSAGCQVCSFGDIILRSHQIFDFLLGVKLVAKISANIENTAL